MPLAPEQADDRDTPLPSAWQQATDGGIGTPDHANGPPKAATWAVPPDISLVRVIRRALADAARSWELGLSEGVLCDLMLCASEIITNAIVHTGTEASVRLTWTGHRLRVEVQDSSLRLPKARSAATPDTSGRGLALVEGVASAWGSDPAGAGKVVWFEISSDQAAGPGKGSCSSASLSVSSFATGATGQREEHPVTAVVQSAPGADLPATRVHASARYRRPRALEDA